MLHLSCVRAEHVMASEALLQSADISSVSSSWGRPCHRMDLPRHLCASLPKWRLLSGERDLALRRQGLWGAHSASPESLCCSRKEQSRAVLTDWTCQWEHESRWQKQHCWCLCSVGQAWILAARYAKKQQRGRGNKLQWHSSINPSFFQPITWHKGLSAPLLLLTGWLHAVSHSCPLYWTSHDGGCSSQARRVKETEPDWSN